MTIGPLMLDLAGTELMPEDRELLDNPQVGGVIFFTRNYESPRQIQALVKAVRKAARGEVLLAVDHEGGRVQRFRAGFSRLPPTAAFGKHYTDTPLEALHLARQAGWLMAAEVRSVGVDFSFAPVLDLDFGVSQVIGDRSFHRDPQAVARLATAYMDGMHAAGMAATGKHFPGHGHVTADSHLDIPHDLRPLEAILREDVYPFCELFAQGLEAVMPAHVIYEAVDDQPAGFSRCWIQDILRGKLDFKGVVFSDDLNMEGAGVAGGPAQRASTALAAGCDMILMCNNRQGAIDILDHTPFPADAVSARRRKRMRGQPFMNRSALLEHHYWQQAVQSVTALA